ncbi:MAG: AAA family ATPase [Acidothermus sp.]|nr:AAA family ATPase [Acidothermus sp.]
MEHSERIGQSPFARLLQAYSEILSRQQYTITALSKWPSERSRRAPDFAWIGDDISSEQLFMGTGQAIIKSSHDAFADVRRMCATLEVNPYDRELLYGYPCVIGRTGDGIIRGPLLFTSISVQPMRRDLCLELADTQLRFNPYLFDRGGDPELQSHRLAELVREVPELPLTPEKLRDFVSVLRREIPELEVAADLGGAFTSPPDRPTAETPLTLIDQAVLLIAPKYNYFLQNDLRTITESDHGDAAFALKSLLYGATDTRQTEITSDTVDRANLYFPFPANRAQRKVALLVEDETTSLIHVEGPPGTGKSHTIANLACHLAATGRNVLITSQKDQALKVVDEKLRELNCPHLPATLPRDAAGRAALARQLESIKADRVSSEVQRDRDECSSRHDRIAATLAQAHDALTTARELEHRLAHNARARVEARNIIATLRPRWELRKASHALRRLGEDTDAIGRKARHERERARAYASRLMALDAELRIASATRATRNVLRDMKKLLAKNDKRAANYRHFDDWKNNPARARALLSVLPVWIMSPDDVARLFPCEPGLFDVVIVDEASQVDLPSIFPTLYRAKKAVVVGDTKQMQAARFKMIKSEIVNETFARYELNQLLQIDELDPRGISLLDLAASRCDEEVLLDEHFRSLPPIIEFSNRKWYDGRLRIMTDMRKKRFGSPEQAAVELHFVEGGYVKDGQTNEPEARSLLEFLKGLLKNPSYHEASMGILCLFDEQADLIQKMVLEEISAEDRERHRIVVAQPDGFQGDERDVILYSLSWDDNGMSRQALSQRQRDDLHIQGMLNVMFTRARDEIHIFHSAPIKSFAMASGNKGVLQEWLEHCEEAQKRKRSPDAKLGKVDSEFEAQVADALQSRGVEVIHQYPACGYRIDLVCKSGDRWVGVECDGERYHLDELGNQRPEDLYRQDVLERAGWTIVRIPYSKWRRNPEEQIEKVLSVLAGNGERGDTTCKGQNASSDAAPQEKPTRGSRTLWVSKDQSLFIEGVRRGLREKDELIRFVLRELGYKRLGPRIRNNLEGALAGLIRDKILVYENDLYLLPQSTREASLCINASTESSAPRPTSRTSSQHRRRRRSYPRYRYLRYY